MHIYQMTELLTALYIAKCTYKVEVPLVLLALNRKSTGKKRQWP